jgi:hypothetical protein
MAAAAAAGSLPPLASPPFEDEPGGPPINPDRVERLECIGRGSYGDVYRGVDAATGRQLAIKVIDLEDIEDDIEDIHRVGGVCSVCVQCGGWWQRGGGRRRNNHTRRAFFLTQGRSSRAHSRCTPQN